MYVVLAATFPHIQIPKFSSFPQIHINLNHKDTKNTKKHKGGMIAQYTNSCRLLHFHISTLPHLHIFKSSNLQIPLQAHHLLKLHRLPSAHFNLLASLHFQ